MSGSVTRRTRPDSRRLVLEGSRRARIWKYRLLSTGPRPPASSRVLQPVLTLGPGRIAIGADVEFGWWTSQGFHTGYCHLEAARPEAVIEVGDGARLNNDVFVKSEGPGISIGRRALIGSRVCLYDSDFHALDPAHRIGGTPAMARVVLEDNVFIGDRTIVLKGVVIGRDTVIGAGSVVTRPIPPGVIAVGNPARVIGRLDRRSLDLAAARHKLATADRVDRP